jgi:hypothetical protein
VFVTAIEYKIAAGQLTLAQLGAVLPITLFPAQYPTGYDSAQANKYAVWRAPNREQSFLCNEETLRGSLSGAAMQFGLPNAIWVFPWMTYAQLDYWAADFDATRSSALVSIQMPTQSYGEAVMGKYYGYMIWPRPGETMQKPRGAFPGWRDVTFSFRALREITG